MNAKISVVVICIEAIIYLLLHNLHDCNFNVTGLVHFGGKLSSGNTLSSLTSLELLAAEYFWEANIANFIYNLLMVSCSLDALKKSSKRKEMRIKKEKIEVLQQTIYSRKETGK